MNLSSKLIDDAVNEVSKLPGIGKKTALRLVLHLLKQEVVNTEALSQSLLKMRKEIRYCNTCHHIADKEDCDTCHTRNQEMICVIENSQDLIAIENTAQYNGLYHVLGGVISPIEGIAPSDLHIDSLLKRIEENQEIKEVILALSPTMEGDTTAFYLTKKLKDKNLRISTIARGVPIGSEIEYTDEITLGRSILSRIHYEG